jgi:hypothetical protein
MIQDRTLNEIQHEGLAALKDRLGVAGMVRFLQQFEHGSGDYATQRHEWVDRLSMDKIRAIAKLKADVPPTDR